MKLNYTIQDLRDSLKKAIYESTVNSKDQHEIIAQISKRGYELGFISGVLEGNVLLDSLSLVDLGVFALEIYKISSLGYINPEIFLTDVEMDMIKKYKKDKGSVSLEYPVVFENVRQISYDMWSAIIPAKLIASLGNSNMLNYEFDTQREARVIETDEGIILTPTINTKSVNEIKERLLTGTFIQDELTFNLPYENRDNFKWDATNNRWILLNGKLNIIDGYHRYLAITAALREKNIDYNFEVRLTNFDDDKARRFIVQKDKQNPIDKEYIKSIDESDYVTQIINQLNQNSRSDLRGKITTDRKTIYDGYSLVTFDILYKSIEKLWQPKSIGEVDNITDYLRTFYNRLMYLYPDDFSLKIRSSSKDNSLANEKMFIVYTVMAKKLENNNEWKEELKDIMKKIDINNETIKEFISTPISIVSRRFNSHFKTASNIAEVIISG